jgi:L-lactate dehydrogenase complex protein LldG
MRRIRHALADSPHGRGEEKPALERAQASRRGEEGLADQFRNEMEKLGGRVVETPSEEKLNEYIAGFLQPGMRVAVSDVVSTRWPGICDRISAKGIEIVPALREFATSFASSSSTKRRAGTAGKSTAERAEDSREAPGLPLRSPDTTGEGPSGAAQAVDEVASLMESYKLALFEAGAGITMADFAIADTGTLVLLSKKHIDTGGSVETAGASVGASPVISRADGEQHRLISLVPPIHICLLDRTRIVANLTELLSLVHKEFYSTGGPPLAMTFISGPSRTADIELTLTRGVHGPREVHVLLWA